MMALHRRDFLKHSATLAGVSVLSGSSLFADDKKEPLFKISLAQWSLQAIA